MGVGQVNQRLLWKGRWGLEPVNLLLFDEGL